jgi:hypothetical protein
MGWDHWDGSWHGLTRALAAGQVSTLDRPGQLLNFGAASSSPVQSKSSAASSEQRSAAQHNQHSPPSKSKARIAADTPGEGE